MKIDHIQLAIPPGSEDKCRPFWRAICFVEVAKPEALQGRGGLWLRHDAVEVHLGIDPDFKTAGKAHPGFATPDLDGTAKALQASGAKIQWDTALSARRRFFTQDPVGNRIEFLEG